jgi:hypothetical protein
MVKLTEPKTNELKEEMKQLMKILLLSKTFITDVAKEVDAQESDSQLLYSTLSCALAAHAFSAFACARATSLHVVGENVNFQA